MSKTNFEIHNMTLESTGQIKLIIKFYMVQGFCPLKTEIARFLTYFVLKNLANQGRMKH